LSLGCERAQQNVTPAPQVPNEQGVNLVNGARIVFFGDSITRAGTRPGGYVTLVSNSLQTLYPDLDIQVMGVGVTGNRVPHLQARLTRDVLSKRPTHVVIYIGVNDVGQRPLLARATGTEKEDYRRGLVDLITRIERTGAEAILCTPSVIGEDPDSGSNANSLLDEYAAISRDVAARAGARLVDLRASFVEYLRAHNEERNYKGVLTLDGIHLNEKGNRLAANQILRAFYRPQASPEQTPPPSP
jgi:lysophospholipase L1-like esterase